MLVNNDIRFINYNWPLNYDNFSNYQNKFYKKYFYFILISIIKVVFFFEINEILCSYIY